MALGTNHIDNTLVDGSNPGGFLPTKWIDEVIVTYESNLVLANKIKTIPFQGQKGDALILPSLTDRPSPTAKAEDTQVTLVQRTVSDVTLNLDQHWEYSFLIEDRTALQALDSLLRENVQNAGYALARKVDQDIFAAMENMQGNTNFDGAVIGSDGSTAWAGAAGTASANNDALTDAGIRQIIQTLDDSDVPMMNRHLVVPPSERNNLMGLARFTEQAFVGSGSTIRNGIIGDVYGVDVSVSTNCPWIHTDADEAAYTFSSTPPADGSYTDITGTTTTMSSAVATGRIAAMFHKDCIALGNQMDVRMQDQYKQEYLGTLYTADVLYGVTEVRDYSCVPIAVAN